MCDMLGISTSRPSPPDERLFRLLFQRGRYNPDGWGVAWYQGRRAEVIKSPTAASLGTAERFLKRHGTAKSSLFIIHLRGASVGRVTCDNTHPFHRTIGGKEYVFAHNGHLDRHHHLPVNRFTPHGQTDSERLFCHLLYRIETEGIRRWTPQAMQWLERTLHELNKDGQRARRRYGKLNCLLSDGEFLFFYHDLNGFNRYWTLQQPATGGIRHGKPGFFAISMCKLTREKWKRARKGKLVVLRNGKNIHF